MGQQQDQGRNQRHLETNENEDKTILSHQDIGKANLRGKFEVLQAYLKKREREKKNSRKAEINNLTSNLKELGTWNKTTNKPQSEQRAINNKDKSSNK